MATGKDGSGNNKRSSQLMVLFEKQLQEMLWSEKALVEALPQMGKEASTDELVNALQEHLQETNTHVQKLEQVFKSVEKNVQTVKSLSMEAVLEKGKQMMQECEKGMMCDAAIIAVAQMAEHLEMAAYGTLAHYAEVLEMREAKDIFVQILDQEKNADKKLTKIATSVVNVEAARQEA